MSGGEASGRSAADHPLARVLVVGAEKPLAALALDHLASHRCRVVTPHDALPTLRSWAPTLALMTVDDAPSLDLLRALMDEAPLLPVIVAARPPFTRLALRAGAFAALTADDPASLRAALREVLVEDDELAMLVPP